MAFSQPNSRELQNRKILEEIQLKKQLLLKQGVAPTLGTPLAVTPASSASNLTPTTTVDGMAISASQRAALHNAHAASAGFFVTQDSSFGNLILPVLPRFDNNEVLKMARLRLRELEEHLQDIESFESPKILLEQYATSAHIGACILHTAQMGYDDIENCAVADLGAGCGVLSLGARLLGACYVVGFEIDTDALMILRKNCNELETDVETVQCDVLTHLPGKFDKCFDTVIMNPPFGTKHNAGIDMKFLEKGVRLARRAVYSLHKTSTRSHVLGKAKQLGTTAEVLAELRYDLPRAYKFHKSASVDIRVDLIRFQVNLPSCSS